MKPEQELQMVGEVERGAKAKQLLASSIYQECMKKVEDGIIENWKGSPIRDVEGQQYLRLMMKCLTDLQRHIRDVAATGKMAEVQLEHERGLVERAKAAVTEFRRR